MKAIYPGSFDPLTLGHMDIIKRASKFADELLIGVLNNSSKSNPMFTPMERVELIREALVDLPNVSVKSFDGLLVDFVKQEGASIVIRGLRAFTDFEYELTMSQTNNKLYPDMDTVFFTTNIEYSYLSSTTVREVAWNGGDITGFVPENIAKAVYEKVKK